MAKSTAKSAKQQSATTANVAGEAAMISTDKLIPRAENGRKLYSKDKLKELSQSIKENGVLEPLLVRPLDGGLYEIVAGWRRWTAAKIVKVSEVPCYIRNMADEEAAYAGAIENLQREDLDPVDEAAEFARLLGDGKSAKAVAQRLGKEPRYVIKRVQLANLIEEAAEDLRAGRIHLGHALEIAPLLPKDQKLALDECYGTDYVDGKQVPDKEYLDLTVEDLHKWIESHLMLVLERAPFPLEDDRLREDGLTCLKCPMRTSQNQMLFDDLSNQKDRCRDRECFAGKTVQFVKLEASRIKPKGSDQPAPIIVDYGYQPQEGQLGRNSFFIEEKASERCENAERAVWGAGNQLGKTAWICRDKECPKHAGRVSKLSSSSNGSSGVKVSGNPAAALTKTRERKQEIFNMRSDEKFRRKVFGEVRKQYKLPLSLVALERVAWRLFKGLEHHHKATVREEIGVDVDAFSQVKAMKDKELAAFLAFCSIVHEGANRYGASGNHVSQKGVIDLAEEHDVDWKKLDAQARVEVAEKERGYKKHISTVKLYLEEVEAGKKSVEPPNLFNPDGESPFTHMLKKPYSYGDDDEGDFEDSEALAKPEGEEEDDELDASKVWDEEEAEDVYGEEEDDD